MTQKLPYQPVFIYRLAFIAGIVILMGLLLYRLLLVFSYNGEIGGIDNNFVYDVMRAMDGHTLYTNPAAYPYAITLYPPFYYDLCAVIGKLVHVNTNEPIQVYQLCRSVSLACDVITCLTLYQLLRKRTGSDKEVSLFATAAFACTLCYLGYTFSRCDSLFLTFYALSFYVLTGNPAKTSRVLLLALLSVACLFSKQTGIILPVLVVSWLLMTKNKKAALYYAVFFIAFFFATAGMYLFIFNYTYLPDNAIKALQNRIDLAWFYMHIFKRMMNSLWMIPLYTAFFISISSLRKTNGSRDKSLGVVSILQLLFSLATSLKHGSSAGYFNESFFLSFLVIASWLNGYTTETAAANVRKAIAFAVPLLFLFFIHTVTEGYLFFIQHRNDKKTLYEQQREIRTWLLSRPGQHSLLNTGTPNTDFFKTIFYKEIAVPNMDMVTCCTMPDGNFDYSLLKQDLANGRIAYLIAPEKTSFTDIGGISLQHYRKDTVINGYTIYKSGE